MDDAAMSRWLALLYASHLIRKFCGKNAKCIGRKSSSINEYIKQRQKDILIYLKDIKNGNKAYTLNSFFAEELLDEDEQQSNT